MKSVAEVPVRLALPRPVAHVLCNRQALRVVLDGLAEVPLRPIRVAEVPVRRALPHPVAHLLCNRQVLRVAEATRVRSMQDRHLLLKGLPGAHSTQTTGRPCNKAVIDYSNAPINTNVTE